MTVESKLLNISDELIDEIRNVATSLKYTTSSNLFYTGQIPIVAYLVLAGQIHFTSKGKITNSFKRGSIIGLKELMENTKLDVDAQVQPGTEVCFIDKSTILRIQSEKSPSPLKELINKLIKIDTSLRQSVSA